MTSDASMLCVKGCAEGMVADGYEPLKDLMTTFVDNGIEIAGAPKTMAYLTSGAHLLA